MDERQSIPGKERVGEAAEQVKQQATSRLSSQKENVASSLSAAARAMRETQTRLRDQDQPLVAEYADSAAGQIDRLANYLREKDLDEMVGEVERFARRQPALFLGGSLLLGILGARFLKSSGQRPEQTGGYYRGAYGYRGAPMDEYGQRGTPRGTRSGPPYGGRPTTPGQTPGSMGGTGTTGGAGTTGGSGWGGSMGGTTGGGMGGSTGGGTRPPTTPSQTGTGTPGQTGTGTPGQIGPSTPGQSNPNPDSPPRPNNPAGGSGGR
ncbi:MAG: hypothetical protein ACYC4L_18425 [Chloroflexota bacterium]